MINLPLEYLKRKMRLKGKGRDKGRDRGKSSKPMGKLEIVVFGCDKDVFRLAHPPAHFCKCLLSR